MHNDVIGHTHPDDQYRVTPSGAGHEHTDAHVWIIVRFLGWLVVAAVIIHVGLGLLFQLFSSQRIETAAPRYPLTSSQVEKLPPEPRLQQFPREDILIFRTREEALLNSYGWLNKGAGTVHIPIDRAMEMIAKRGLPTRAEDTPTPDRHPSDASAGR